MSTSRSNQSFISKPLAIRTIEAVCLCLSALLFLSTASNASPKKLLILHSYHKGFKWTDNVMKGIDSSLLQPKKSNISLLVEYMDTKNFPKEKITPKLLELYKTKYAGSRPDVIITSDDNALNFMLVHGDELFPQAPVVFCGVNNFQDSLIKGRDNYTGVLEDYDIKGTVDLAIKLHPTTKNLVIVTDSTPTGKVNRKRFHQLSDKYSTRLNIIDLHDLTTAELVSKLKSLPPLSLILNLSFFRDKNGVSYSAYDGNQVIAKSTSAPIYSCWDFYLETGIVGGRVVSGFMQGAEAANMAKMILSGTPVSEIPILRQSPNRFMFDYGPLVHAGISLGALPEDSVVLNIPESFYRKYRPQILLSTVAIGLMAILIMVMAFNILQRRKAQYELQSIFDNSQVGIVQLKGGRNVYRCNQRLADILGYDSPDALIGKPVNMFHLDEEHFKEFGKRFYEGLNSKTQQHIEFQLRHKTGKPVWVMLSGKALDPSPQPNLDLGVVWVAEDITQRKKAEEELEKLNRQLETKVRDRTHDLKAKADQLKEANHQLLKLDEMKSAFLNTVSHDLRTPLTSIRGFATLIRRDFDKTFANATCDDPRSGKISQRIGLNLKIIEQEGDRLTRLINDFLDLSKIESGKFTWRDRTVDMHHVIEQAVEIAEGQLAEKPKLTLNVKAAETFPQLVADEDRLLQVLSNLLSNAIKYTEEGRITLRATAPTHDRIQVQIEDTGIGIPSSDQRRIFDKFHQVETSNTLRTTGKGSGLGLAICKEIITHYGGEIWVDSVPDIGSTFAFSLPVK